MSTVLTNFEYLVNPVFANVLTSKSTTTHTISSDELSFYKRRIFALTKSLLQGTPSDNTNINMIFERYAMKCIEYFKFNDKKTLIQGDYKGLVVDQSGDDDEYDGDPDNLMLRKPDTKIPKITDHIDIKTTKTKKQTIIPQIRRINLKDKIYKNAK